MVVSAANKTGWVVVKMEFGRESIVEPYFNLKSMKYDSISGYGCIFVSCAEARKAASELNESWSGSGWKGYFAVRRAVLCAEPCPDKVVRR